MNLDKDIVCKQYSALVNHLRCEQLLKQGDKIHLKENIVFLKSLTFLEMIQKIDFSLVHQ